MAGYLLTEVLDRQSPELVAILETISVVDLVCADLADALTGRHDGARVLADLAAAHLFVQAVGQPGRWYRLHRLIADILRARPDRGADGGTCTGARQSGSAATPCRWRRSVRRSPARTLAPGRRLGWHPRPHAHHGRSRPGSRADVGEDRPHGARRATELAGALALARVARGSDAEAAALISVGRAAGGSRSARRAARAQVLLDVSASGLARIAGDSEAAMTALGSLPVAAEALAELGMAGAEIVPVVVANNRGTAALWAADLDAPSATSPQPCTSTWTDSRFRS